MKTKKETEKRSLSDKHGWNVIDIDKTIVIIIVFSLVHV